MKKYLEYVSGNLNDNIFITDYKNIIGKIEVFWNILEDKLEKIGNINNRNENDVLNYNNKEKQERKERREKRSQNIPLCGDGKTEIIKGKLYNYKTKNNKIVIVEILNPNAGNNKSQVKYGNATYVANWTDLTPYIEKPLCGDGKTEIIKDELYNYKLNDVDVVVKVINPNNGKKQAEVINTNSNQEMIVSWQNLMPYKEKSGVETTIKSIIPETPEENKKVVAVAEQNKFKI